MRTLLVLHALAQLGDMVTTYVNLTYFGFMELNPAMAWAFAAGPQYFFLSKLAATLAVTALLWSRRHYKSAMMTAKFVMVMMWGVVLWNILGAVIYVT